MSEAMTSNRLREQRMKAAKHKVLAILDRKLRCSCMRRLRLSCYIAGPAAVF